MAYGKASQNNNIVKGRVKDRFGEWLEKAYDVITRGGGGQQASVQLMINAGEDSYYCETAKAYTDKFNIQQEVDAGTVASNNSQFIKLTSSAKDPAAASFHNAKAILIKNISNITAEVYLRLQAWKNNGQANS